MRKLSKLGNKLEAVRAGSSRFPDSTALGSDELGRRRLVLSWGAGVVRRGIAEMVWMAGGGTGDAQEGGGVVCGTRRQKQFAGQVQQPGANPKVVGTAGRGAGAAQEGRSAVF